MTVEVESSDGYPGCRKSASPGRFGHRSMWTAHGAEIEATAPCLSVLFDEIGMALAQLASAEDAGAPASSWEPVDLRDPDLAGLACTWLNELMHDADLHRAELVDVAVDAVTLPEDGSDECWRLQGRVGLRPLFGHHGPGRHDLHATTGAVSADATDGTWRLRAHLVPGGAASPDHVLEGERRLLDEQARLRAAGELVALAPTSLPQART
jgi:hypothetical protein